MVERSTWLAVGAGLIAIGLLSAPARAQWTAKAEAGLVAARGNTDTDSSNVKFDATRKYVRWQHTGGFTGVYAADRTGTTAQRWELRGQSDYDFHKQGFSYASARYEEDRFSGFEFQTTYGLGLGWRLFDDPVTKLTAQIGFGYKTFTTQQALADDEVTVIERRRQQNAVAQGRINFEHAVSETTSVLGRSLIEADEDNTFLHNELSLQVDILAALALAVGFSVRYNTDPPPGFNRTDALTTLNLVYELK